MAYVVFHNDQLKDWRSMTKPTKSQTDAAGALQQLINQFQPDVVVTEKINSEVPGTSVERLKAAIQRTAAQNYVLDVNVEEIAKLR